MTEQSLKATANIRQGYMCTENRARIPTHHMDTGTDGVSQDCVDIRFLREIFHGIKLYEYTIFSSRILNSSHPKKIPIDGNQTIDLSPS